ncbi:phosphate acetyltransferase domain protein [Peptoniphilus sp. oral taxon 375 str. F0436]|nr:phosphate acetyltransferase domain protein [Peptoniphilus sp. oral taxon 375 str. F0436]
MGFIEELKSKVSAQCPSIVFPEGEDERILGACVRLKEEKILAPVVLGNIDEIKKQPKKRA